MDAQHHYRQQSVETATPAQLISMLYHEAVATVVRAEQHIRAEDAPAANHELQRAQAIVHELRSSLDFERGGEIAHNLDALYDFCLDRLVAANMSKQVGELPAVRSTLAELGQAWDQMAAGVGAGAGQRSPAGVNG